MKGFLLLAVAACCTLAAAQYDSPIPQRIGAVPGAVPSGAPPNGGSPTRVLRQRVPAARFLQAQQEAAAAAAAAGAAGGIPQGTPVRVRRPGGVRGGRVPAGLPPRPVIEEAEPVIQTAPPPPPTQPFPQPQQFATAPPQSQTLSPQIQQHLQQQQQQQQQQEQQQLQSLQAPSISEIQLADDGHLVGSPSPSPSPSPSTPPRPLFLQPTLFRSTRPAPLRPTPLPQVSASPDGFLPTTTTFTDNTRGYLPTSSATPQPQPSPQPQPQLQVPPQSFRRRPAVPFRPERPVPVVSSTPPPLYFQQLVNEDEDIITHNRRVPAPQRTATRPTAAPVEPLATPRPRPRPERPIEQRPRPQGKPQRERRPVAQILRRYREDNPDGSITWGYENDDGSFKEETIGIDCMVRGKYGYVDPDGNRREYTYQSGIPCAATEASISDSAAAAAEGYIDYQNNQLVLPSGQAINLDQMVKNRKRKPVAKIRN